MNAKLWNWPSASLDPTCSLCLSSLFIYLSIWRIVSLLHAAIDKKAFLKVQTDFLPFRVLFLSSLSWKFHQLALHLHPHQYNISQLILQSARDIWRVLLFFYWIIICMSFLYCWKKRTDTCSGLYFILVVSFRLLHYNTSLSLFKVILS